MMGLSSVSVLVLRDTLSTRYVHVLYDIQYGVHSMCCMVTQSCHDL